ncbi:unnamed protein product [Chrysoparadoxa australica]
MKKPNVIAGAILLLIVVSYFVYVAVEKNQKEKNIFLAQKKVEIESLVDSKKFIKVLRYQDRTFQFKDLPEDIQKKIVNEQLRAHQSINMAIKEFLVRFHSVAKKKGDYSNIKVEEIPLLIQVANVLVKEEEVEKLYKENIKKFPKDHDPNFIKQQIRFELQSEEIYKFMMGNVVDIFKTTNSKLPASPSIPDEWVETKGISPSYGDEKAPNHIIWVGHYGCPNCAGYTKDLGLIIQKYGLTNMRITFVPWTKNDIDSYSYLNTLGLCIKDNLSDERFWGFHSIAMNQSDMIVGMDPTDLQKARNFAREVMKSNEFTQEEQDKAFGCVAKFDESNKTLNKYVLAKRRLSFLPYINAPMILFNGRLLDIEGRRLFHEIDRRMKELLK